jgi:mannose-6-phosphate isomerase
MLGKPIGPESDYSESWEICDHGADQSVVASGAWRGTELQNLIREAPSELLGQHFALPHFPLLVKFLDAHDHLSVQVHPDDFQASRFVAGERGKTEAWVVMAAEPDSCVYAGLQPGVDETILRQAISLGTVTECLHRVTVAADDCIFIPAGTVHAIGGGILLAEVQQSSDLTFRMFDWNRLGSDGKSRDLHVEQALQCINFAAGPVNKITPRPFPGAGAAGEDLVACQYFTIRRHRLMQPLTIADDRRCRIMITLAGSLECTGCGERESANRGETLLVPASALPATVVPQEPAIALEVYWD